MNQLGLCNEMDQRSEPPNQTFHLRRIGPKATKDGVADTMDFIKTTSLIGRNKARVDYLLDSSNHVASQYISRLHARMVVQENKMCRLFNDSLNGIFVNNTKMCGSVILQEGDKVTFGHPYGAQLATGTWQRQPDSEYQFIFERCTCSSQQKKKPGILEDKVNIADNSGKIKQQKHSSTDTGVTDTVLTASKILDSCINKISDLAGAIYQNTQTMLNTSNSTSMEKSLDQSLIAKGPKDSIEGKSLKVMDLPSTLEIEEEQQKRITDFFQSPSAPKYQRMSQNSRPATILEDTVIGDLTLPSVSIHEDPNPPDIIGGSTLGEIQLSTENELSCLNNSGDQSFGSDTGKQTEIRKRLSLKRKYSDCMLEKVQAASQTEKLDVMGKDTSFERDPCSSALKLPHFKPVSDNLTEHVTYVSDTVFENLNLPTNPVSPITQQLHASTATSAVKQQLGTPITTTASKHYSVDKTNEAIILQVDTSEAVTSEWGKPKVSSAMTILGDTSVSTSANTSTRDIPIIVVSNTEALDTTVMETSQKSPATLITLETLAPNDAVTLPANALTLVGDKHELTDTETSVVGTSVASSLPTKETPEKIKTVILQLDSSVTANEDLLQLETSFTPKAVVHSKPEIQPGRTEQQCQLHRPLTVTNPEPVASCIHTSSQNMYSSSSEPSSKPDSPCARNTQSLNHKVNKSSIEEYCSRSHTIEHGANKQAPTSSSVAEILTSMCDDFHDDDMPFSSSLIASKGLCAALQSPMKKINIDETGHKGEDSVCSKISTLKEAVNFEKHASTIHEVLIDTHSTAHGTVSPEDPTVANTTYLNQFNHEMPSTKGNHTFPTLAGGIPITSGNTFVGSHANYAQESLTPAEEMLIGPNGSATETGNSENVASDCGSHESTSTGLFVSAISSKGKGLVISQADFVASVTSEESIKHKVTHGSEDSITDSNNVLHKQSVATSCEEISPTDDDSLSKTGQAVKPVKIAPCVMDSAKSTEMENSASTKPGVSEPKLMGSAETPIVVDDPVMKIELVQLPPVLDCSLGSSFEHPILLGDAEETKEINFSFDGPYGTCAETPIEIDSPEVLSDECSKGRPKSSSADIKSIVKDVSDKSTSISEALSTTKLSSMEPALNMSGNLVVTKEASGKQNLSLTHEERHNVKTKAQTQSTQCSVLSTKNIVCSEDKTSRVRLRRPRIFNPETVKQLKTLKGNNAKELQTKAELEYKIFRETTESVAKNPDAQGGRESTCLSEVENIIKLNYNVNKDGDQTHIKYSKPFKSAVQIYDTSHMPDDGKKGPLKLFSSETQRQLAKMIHLHQTRGLKGAEEEHLKGQKRSNRSEEESHVDNTNCLPEVDVVVKSNYVSCSREMTNGDHNYAQNVTQLYASESDLPLTNDIQPGTENMRQAENVVCSHDTCKHLETLISMHKKKELDNVRHQWNQTKERKENPYHSSSSQDLPDVSAIVKSCYSIASGKTKSVPSTAQPDEMPLMEDQKATGRSDSQIRIFNQETKLRLEKLSNACKEHKMAAAEVLHYEFVSRWKNIDKTPKLDQDWQDKSYYEVSSIVQENYNIVSYVPEKHRVFSVETEEKLRKRIASHRMQRKRDAENSHHKFIKRLSASRKTVQIMGHEQDYGFEEIEGIVGSNYTLSTTINDNRYEEAKSFGSKSTEEMPSFALGAHSGCKESIWQSKSAVDENLTIVPQLYGSNFGHSDDVSCANIECRDPDRPENKDAHESSKSQWLSKDVIHVFIPHQDVEIVESLTDRDKDIETSSDGFITSTPNSEDAENFPIIEISPVANSVKLPGTIPIGSTEYGSLLQKDHLSLRNKCENSTSGTVTDNSDDITFVEDQTLTGNINPNDHIGGTGEGKLKSSDKMKANGEKLQETLCGVELCNAQNEAEASQDVRNSTGDYNHKNVIVDLVPDDPYKIGFQKDLITFDIPTRPLGTILSTENPEHKNEITFRDTHRSSSPELFSQDPSMGSLPHDTHALNHTMTPATAVAVELPKACPVLKDIINGEATVCKTPSPGTSKTFKEVCPSSQALNSLTNGIEDIEVATGQESVMKAPCQEIIAEAMDQETVEVTDQENNAEVLDKENGAGSSNQENDIKLTNPHNVAEVTNQENSADTIDQENNADAIDQEKNVEVTHQENSADTIDQENNADAIDQEKNVEVTDQENSADAIDQENNADAIDQEKNVEVTDQENSADAIDQENNAEVTDQEKNVEVTDQENSADAIDQENNADAIDQEKNVEVTDQENSADAIDQENSADAIDQENNAEVTDQERVVEMNAEVSSRHSDVLNIDKENVAKVTDLCSDAKSTEQESCAEVTNQERCVVVTEKGSYIEVTNQESIAEVTNQENSTEVTDKENSTEVTDQESIPEVTDQETCAEVTIHKRGKEVTDQDNDAEVMDQDNDSEATDQRNGLDVTDRVSNTKVANKDICGEALCLKSDEEVEYHKRIVESTNQERGAEVTDHVTGMKATDQEIGAEVVDHKIHAEESSAEVPDEETFEAVIDQEKGAEVTDQEISAEGRNDEMDAGVTDQEDFKDVADKESCVEVGIQQKAAEVSNQENGTQVACKECDEEITDQESGAEITDQRTHKNDIIQETPEEVIIDHEGMDQMVSEVAEQETGEVTEQIIGGKTTNQEIARNFEDGEKTADANIEDAAKYVEDGEPEIGAELNIGDATDLTIRVSESDMKTCNNMADVEIDKKVKDVKTHTLTSQETSDVAVQELSGESSTFSCKNNVRKLETKRNSEVGAKQHTVSEEKEPDLAKSKAKEPSTENTIFKTPSQTVSSSILPVAIIGDSEPTIIKNPSSDHFADRSIQGEHIESEVSLNEEVFLSQSHELKDADDMHLVWSQAESSVTQISSASGEDSFCLDFELFSEKNEDVVLNEHHAIESVDMDREDCFSIQTSKSNKGIGKGLESYCKSIKDGLDQNQIENINDANCLQTADITSFSDGAHLQLGEAIVKGTGCHIQDLDQHEKDSEVSVVEMETNRQKMMTALKRKSPDCKTSTPKKKRLFCNTEDFHVTIASDIINPSNALVDGGRLYDKQNKISQDQGTAKLKNSTSVVISSSLDTANSEGTNSSSIRVAAGPEILASTKVDEENRPKAFEPEQFHSMAESSGQTWMSNTNVNETSVPSDFEPFTIIKLKNVAVTPQGKTEAQGVIKLSHANILHPDNSSSYLKPLKNQNGTQKDKDSLDPPHQCVKSLDIQSDIQGQSRNATENSDSGNSHYSVPNRSINLDHSMNSSCPKTSHKILHYMHNKSPQRAVLKKDQMMKNKKNWLCLTPINAHLRPSTHALEHPSKEQKIVHFLQPCPAASEQNIHMSPALTTPNEPKQTISTQSLDDSSFSSLVILPVTTKRNFHQASSATQVGPLSSVRLLENETAMEELKEQLTNIVELKDDTQRMNRRKKLHQAVLAELEKLTLDINTALSMANPDKHLIKSLLEDLDEVPITPGLLAHFPNLMQALCKCQGFSGSEDIRQLSSTIYARYKALCQT